MVDVNKPHLGQAGETKAKMLAWGDGSTTHINEMGEFEDDN